MLYGAKKISCWGDLQTDELSDHNRIPLPAHPRTKYIARSQVKLTISCKVESVELSSQPALEWFMHSVQDPIIDPKRERRQNARR